MQQPLIYHAIKKYGWKRINHEILFTDLTKEEAEQKEIELIAFYKSNDRKNGYNIANGGNHCGKHSKETIEKIRAANAIAHKNVKHAKGWHHSEETKKMFSEMRKGKSTKGRHWSDEAKQRISKIRKGRKLSEETKIKMSQSRSKKVMCLESGAVYLSAKEAGVATNIVSSNIVRVCNGKRNTAGGYHWRYANDI